MKHAALTLLALFLGAFTKGEEIQFDTPPPLPASVFLHIPPYGEVITHKRTISADVITVKMEDRVDAGMSVIVKNEAAKVIWRRNFGYNTSALPGCRASVSSHPELPFMKVSYHGYKWDHSSTLLLLKQKNKEIIASEFSEFERDIFPSIKQHKNYSKKYRYQFSFLSFSDEGVIIECIPLETPESQSSHPFHQDHTRWFKVTAKLGEDLTLIPTSVVPHRE